MKKLSYLALMIVIFNNLMFSQEKPLYYLGAYGSYNYNIHWAGFSQLGIPNCCPEFQSGTGNGFSAGILFEYPILEDAVYIGAKSGISMLDGLLSKEEFIANTSVERNGVELTTDVWVDHTVDARVFIVDFEPYINYKFFGLINSYLGLKLGYLAIGEFDQKETITKPDNIVFLPERKLTRNDYFNQEFPGKSTMLMFGIFGLGYDLEMRNHWLITPEIKYALPLNNICEEDWKISSVQIGLALKIPIYQKKPLPVIYDTLFVRDTTVLAVLNLKQEKVNMKSRTSEFDEIEEDDRIIMRTTFNENYEKQINKISNLNASITAVGIKSDGTRTEKPNIVIEETETEEGFPILPYVFFERGKAQLDKTAMNLLTKDDVMNFSDKALEKKTMAIYSQMLNILAYRMKQNPDKEITITGCNSNDGEELNNLQLSKDRALEVKKYFTNVWGIDEKRIFTKWQNLPDIPGNINIPDGISENHRAEIRSSDYEIIKSVSLKDIERKSDPPVIALYPKVESDAEITQFNIDVQQGKTDLRSFKGKDIPQEILWQLDEDPMPLLEEPINIKLAANDKLGQIANAGTSLKLQQLTIKKKRYEMQDDKRIERFFLILFDFNSAELKPHHIKTLNDIKSRIMPESKVIISGFTDRTGDPLYNIELAKRRCLEVQRYLKVDDNNLTINPVGPDQIIFNNDIPEGRSYSRTVQIVIETPVK